MALMESSISISAATGFISTGFVSTGFVIFSGTGFLITAVAEGAGMAGIKVFFAGSALIVSFALKGWDSPPAIAQRVLSITLSSG